MKRLITFIKNSCNAIVFASFVSTIIFHIMCLLLFLSEGDKEYINFSLFLMFFQLSCIFFGIIYNSQKDFHKIDADFIGNNFIGFGKKPRIFRKGVENLFYGKVRQALDDFQNVEENFALNNSEKRLLFYYIGRCYDIMDYSPNALRYYENAEKAGFNDDVLPVVKANTLGKMGDIQQAMEIYNKILNDELYSNRYYAYIRNYVGKLYLDNRQPQEALKWYLEAAERHESYATALGGCALAYLMLGDFENSNKYYQYALVNRIEDAEDFKNYYKEISSAVSADKKQAEIVSEKE